MNENENIIYKDLSYNIIKLALEVHNELGCGFLEKVYENALMLLLDKGKIPARQQAPADIYFQGKVIGQYFADILIDNKLLIRAYFIEHFTGIIV